MIIGKDAALPSHQEIVIDYRGIGTSGQTIANIWRIFYAQLDAYWSYTFPYALFQKHKVEGDTIIYYIRKLRCVKGGVHLEYKSLVKAKGNHGLEFNQ